MRTPIGSACANGEQGTRVGKRREGDCGRRRQQKCTLFRGTIVGLLEPERLVQVRRARAIGSASALVQGAPLPVGSPRDPTGSQVFPVEKKCDLKRLQAPIDKWDNRNRQFLHSRQMFRCVPRQISRATSKVLTCMKAALMMGGPTIRSIPLEDKAMTNLVSPDFPTCVFEQMGK